MCQAASYLFHSILRGWRRPGCLISSISFYCSIRRSKLKIYAIESCLPVLYSYHHSLLLDKKNNSSTTDLPVPSCTFVESLGDRGPPERRSVSCQSTEVLCHQSFLLRDLDLATKTMKCLYGTVQEDVIVSAYGTRRSTCVLPFSKFCDDKNFFLEIYKRVSLID
jgi:hypothetical protein